jgi:hypothetical protein
MTGTVNEPPASSPYHHRYRPRFKLPPRQTRYGAAAVGAGTGMVFLGESYPISMWIGAGIVAAGIVLSTLAGASQHPPKEKFHTNGRSLALPSAHA